MELTIVDKTQEDLRDALGIRKHRQEELNLIARRLFFEAAMTEGSRVEYLSHMASKAENLAEFIILESSFRAFEKTVLEEPMTAIMVATLGVEEFGRRGIEEIDKEWAKLQNT